nr:Gp49 family protein [Pseudomonas koreensis]
MTAPRITFTALRANIAHTEIVKHVSPSGQVLRWAVLTTKNGFSATGRPSVSASSANDNAEIGEKIAIENATQELWPLMGYELKQRLYVAESGPWPCQTCRDAFPAGDSSDSKPVDTSA